jgi:hypothetical protein
MRQGYRPAAFLLSGSARFDFDLCAIVGRRMCPTANVEIGEFAMRAPFLMASFLAFPLAASAQSMVWQKYAVPETGANVDLPTTIFSKDAGQTDQGYGRRFMTPDGHATLAVQSIPNVAHDSPATFLAKKHPPSNIAYKRITSRFFVVSSFRNDSIWYDRCNFAGRFINCVLVNYPAAEKRQWDGIITRLSHTLANR